MQLPRFNKITYGKNTFKYYASHIWNTLPESIKTCTTIDVFISLLKHGKIPNVSAKCVLFYAKSVNKCIYIL